MDVSTPPSSPGTEAGTPLRDGNIPLTITSPLRIAKSPTPQSPQQQQRQQPQQRQPRLGIPAGVPDVARRTSSSFKHVRNNNLVSKSPFKSQIPMASSSSPFHSSSPGPAAGVTFPTRRVSGEKRQRPQSMAEEGETENNRPLFGLKRERKQSKGLSKLVMAEPVTKSPFKLPGAIARTQSDIPQIPTSHPPTLKPYSSMPMPIPSSSSSSTAAYPATKVGSPSPARSSLVSRRMHGPRLSGGRAREKRLRRKTVTFDERCDVLEFERDESSIEISMDQPIESDSDLNNNTSGTEEDNDDQFLPAHDSSYDDSVDIDLDDDDDGMQLPKGALDDDDDDYPDNVLDLDLDPDESISGLVDSIFATAEHPPTPHQQQHNTENEDTSPPATPPHASHRLPPDVETEDGVPLGREHAVRHMSHVQMFEQLPIPVPITDSALSSPRTPESLLLDDDQSTSPAKGGKTTSPPHHLPTPPLGRSTHLERTLMRDEDEGNVARAIGMMPGSPTPAKRHGHGHGGSLLGEGEGTVEHLVPRFELDVARNVPSTVEDTIEDPFGDGSKGLDFDLRQQQQQRDAELADPANLSIGHSEVSLNGLLQDDLSEDDDDDKNDFLPVDETSRVPADKPDNPRTESADVSSPHPDQDGMTPRSGSADVPTTTTPPPSMNAADTNSNSNLNAKRRISRESIHRRLLRTVTVLEDEVAISEAANQESMEVEVVNFMPAGNDTTDERLHEDEDESERAQEDENENEDDRPQDNENENKIKNDPQHNEEAYDTEHEHERRPTNGTASSLSDTSAETAEIQRAVVSSRALPSITTTTTASPSAPLPHHHQEQQQKEEKQRSQEHLTVDEFGSSTNGLNFDFGSKFGRGLGIPGLSSTVKTRAPGGASSNSSSGSTARSRDGPTKVEGTMRLSMSIGEVDVDVDMDARSALDRLLDDVGSVASVPVSLDRGIGAGAGAGGGGGNGDEFGGFLSRNGSTASNGLGGGGGGGGQAPPVPPKDNIKSRQEMILEKRREARRREEGMFDDHDDDDDDDNNRLAVRGGGGGGRGGGGRKSRRRSMSTGDTNEVGGDRGTRGAVLRGPEEEEKLGVVPVDEDLLAESIEKELRKLEGGGGGDRKSKYHVRERGGTIYASSDADRISHMSSTGDVNAGKAWRTVRRPSDMNEYSKQIKEFRSQEKPGKAHGKVFVKVLGIKGLKCPLPDQPTVVTCTLNNGIHFVTTPECRLGRDSRVEQEFELIEHSKLEFTLTMKVRRDPHITAQFKALIPPPPVVVKPVPPPAPIPLVQTTSRGGMRSFFSSSPKKSHKEKEKATPAPPPPRVLPPPVQQPLPENLARYLKSDGTLARAFISFKDIAHRCDSRLFETNYPLIGQRVELGGKVSTLQVGEVVLQMFRLPALPGLAPEQLPQSLEECHRGLRHINWHKVTYFEGILTQSGGDCSSWRRRQLRVIGANLVAFNDVTKKATATIDLKKAIAIEDDQELSPASGATARSSRYADEYDGLYGVERSFRLIFPNEQEIIFFADTDDEKAKWLEVLRALVGHIPPNPLWAELLWQRQDELAKRASHTPTTGNTAPPRQPRPASHPGPRTQRT